KHTVKESDSVKTFVDIPLRGPYYFRHYVYLTYLLFIKADLETTIRRLMHRDFKKRKQSVAFINRQLSDKERVKTADLV
ncbi:dephospho-CoA kinase, partial [Francisella tularensis subsp. holarctica]|uniref:dephospho-CoA kinase n=1 Tax=Francisella tularensis TaxID=263 RepID=UPI002381C268